MVKNIFTQFSLNFWLKIQKYGKEIFRTLEKILEIETFDDLEKIFEKHLQAHNMLKWKNC